MAALRDSIDALQSEVDRLSAVLDLISPYAVGDTELRVLITIVKSHITHITVIRGEVENYGAAAASRVTVDFIGRNDEGAAVSKSVVDMGTVSRGSRGFFTANLPNTSSVSGSNTYLSSVDYVIYYRDSSDNRLLGGTGSLTL